MPRSSTKPGSILTAGQCRAARALLRWTLDDLRRESGVGRSTIASFESESRIPTEANLQAMKYAFEKSGLLIVQPNGGGHGVRWKTPPTDSDGKEGH